MGSVYVTSNAISTSGNTESLTESYILYEAPGVAVVDEGPDTTDAIFVTGFGYVNIMGAVYGPTALFFSSYAYNPSDTTSVQIGSTGSLEASTYGALIIATGQYQVTNAGDIQNSYYDAVELDYETLLNGNVLSNTGGGGGGSLVNTGLISTNTGNAVGNEDNVATDSDVVTNYGTISASNGDGLLDIGGHTTIVYNFGSISGGAGNYAIYASGQEFLTNAGTLIGNVTLGANSTISDSGKITGTVSLSAGVISLDDAHIVISGSSDTVNVTGGADNGVTIGGNGANGATDVVNGANAYIVLTDNSNDQINGSSDTVSIGATCNVAVYGAHEIVNFSRTGSVVNLFSGDQTWDMVTGSGDTVSVTQTYAAVTGGSDIVNMVGTLDDAVVLYGTGGNWDTVNGSDGNVILRGAYAGIVGDDTIQLQGGGNFAVLSGTGAHWDNVTGADDTVLLRGALANISGDETVRMEGTGNYAVLSGDASWENVSGSNATVELRGALAALSGSNNIVIFDSPYGNDLDLIGGTGNVVQGSAAGVTLTNTSATLQGSGGDGVAFQGSDTLTLKNSNEALTFSAGIGGLDTISGFNATDTITLSKSNFANYQALLSSGDLSETGGNTVITLGAGDKITVLGALVASTQFNFV